MEKQRAIVDTCFLQKIAAKDDIDITHKEFESIVKQVGERANWAKINVIWNEKHNRG